MPRGQWVEYLNSDTLFEYNDPAYLGDLAKKENTELKMQNRQDGGDVGILDSEGSVKMRGVVLYLRCQ